MNTKNSRVLKRLAIAFAIVFTAAVIYTDYLAPHTLEAKQRTQLESTQRELIKTRNELIMRSISSKEEATKQLEQINQLNQQLKETQAQLQARREANTAVAVAVPEVSGNKEVWLTAAGIPQSDWQYVDYIITRESGWNPNATNASSGAHGLPQALPYSKTGCGWVDAVCQLRWASGYAKGRYGSWANAVSFWQQKHWW